MVDVGGLDRSVAEGEPSTITYINMDGLDAG